MIFFVRVLTANITGLFCRQSGPNQVALLMLEDGIVNGDILFKLTDPYIQASVRPINAYSTRHPYAVLLFVISEF